MKVGDLIKFTKSDEYAIFIGYTEEMRTFFCKYGFVQIPNKSFMEENVEVINASR